SRRPPNFVLILVIRHSATPCPSSSSMFGALLSVVRRWLNPVQSPTLAAPPTDAVPGSVAPAAAVAGQGQSLIAKVTALTSAVAQDVGNHNHSLQSISGELTAAAESNPGAVATVVYKLLVANDELQKRLERAELTLHSHSRQLRDAVISARTDSLTGL